MRLPGLEARTPAPYVLGTGPLPPESALAQAGAQQLATLDLAPLAAAGINRLLVEGGARTARAFLEAGLVDEIQLFQSPHALGGQGVSAWAGRTRLDGLAGFRPTHEEMLGDDRLTVYGKA